jgi:UDP-glucose 4-epimerase
VVRAFLADEWEVAVLDNLSTGHAESVPEPVITYNYDAGLMAGIQDALRAKRADVVIYCAGLRGVSRSMQFPQHYYHNNFVAVFYLLEAMRACNVKKFLFSSDFSIHGAEPAVPITEKSPAHPVSPLGKVLQAVEGLLADLAGTDSLSYATMRVGNIAGALPSGELGPWPNGGDRLLGMALDVALGLRASLPIYGTGLPTVDGTPVRDYVHICDVVDAYLSAAGRLSPQGGGRCYLLGTGDPVSVTQVVRRVEELTGRHIPTVSEARRPNQPISIYADAADTRQALRWAPCHNLNQIIESEWKWRLGKGKTFVRP